MILKRKSMVLVCSMFLCLSSAWMYEYGAKAEPNVVVDIEPAYVKEKLVGEKPPDAKDLVISPDGRRFAYKVKRNKNWIMVIDGKPGPEYDDVRTGRFSPDSQHFAYNVKNGKNYQVILDGKEYGEANKDGAGGGLTFSADGQHISYYIGRGKKTRVVIDGQVQEHEWARQGGGGPLHKIVLSADGQRWATWIRAESRKHIMLTESGRPGHESLIDFPLIGPMWSNGSLPVFSPNSQRLAYTAVRKNKWFMVIDGKEHKEYDYVSTPVFSPDSRRIAYLAGVKTLPIFGIFIDGKLNPQKILMTDFFGQPLFSPDSKHVAFIAVSGKKIVQIMDKQVTYPSVDEEFEADRCGQLTFSPDNQRLAFVAMNTKKSRGSSYKSILIVDGRQYGSVQELIGAVTFSPDSRFISYATMCDKKATAIINDREGKTYDTIIVSSLAYSADEKQVIYTALKGNKIYLVTQDVE